MASGKLQPLGSSNWEYVPPLALDNEQTYAERLWPLNEEPDALIRIRQVLCQHCDAWAPHLIDGYGFCDDHLKYFERRRLP